MYRVIIEPIIRVNVPEDFRAYFPSKFVTNLTPRPEILSMIQQNMQNQGQGKPPEQEASAVNAFVNSGLPIWENLILTFLLIGILLSISWWILRKRSLN